MGLFCGFDTFAESACRADISYSWVKTVPHDAGVDEVKGTTTPVKGSSNPSSSEEPSPAIYKVHFTSIERRAGTEEMARTLLEGDIQRQKARAFERCRRAHESFGDCVSTKLSTKGTVLNSLSFSARSQVEKALVDECRVSQGECQAVTASDPICVSIGKDDVKNLDEQESAAKSEDSPSDAAEKTSTTEEKAPVTTKTSEKKK